MGKQQQRAFNISEEWATENLARNVSGKLLGMYAIYRFLGVEWTAFSVSF
jgi:hypothetical protein